MMKFARILAGAAVVFAVIGAAGYYGATQTDKGRILAANLLVRSVPSPRNLAVPGVTAWQPERERYVAPSNPVMGDAGVWRERHGNGRNSDETLLAGAPTFDKAYVIAPDELYFAAISFDRDSNIYASVSLATDGTFLVSYDIRTGKERWRLKTDKVTPAGGVPIVLEDPVSGGEIVYNMSRDEIVAARTDGSVIWRSATGLEDSTRGDVNSTIMWGPSYNPHLDILTGVSAKGELVAFDRQTGRLLTPEPLILPGSPSRSRGASIPDEIIAKMAEEFQKALGRPLSVATVRRVLKVVEGESVKVANYHSIDAWSGRMWLTATAPDEADGKKDDVSEYGALYGLDLKRDAAGVLTLEIGCNAWFKDGSASTPGLRADGKRVYIADGHRSLLAYDESCHPLWSADVGGQIVASPSVAVDNGEIYVVTTTSLVKLIDEDTKGRIVWNADFDMYDAKAPLVQKNLLTAAIAANGVYAHAGLGVLIHPEGDRPGFLPLRNGGVRLDRETGKVLWYAESEGDSTAVTEIAPDGSLVIPQSPIRSIIANIAFPGLAAKTSGGIAVMRPSRQDLLARDAACAAARLAARADQVAAKEEAAVAEDYRSQVKLLLRQARGAAVEAGAAVDASALPDIDAAMLALGDAEAAGKAEAACRTLTK
ncbi:PQQ-binding-like beta-propeller repeat protein [Parvibaculum sp.]|uniref:outer membrane protein assembly factor BamB family protein n=1 Tax=Parvibaculum sp. TaxID=2024848 RepID=UPI002C2B13DC|nr:PQQ-binding-like beta-propeller repeat protein [Parvibaculum sp.]HUD52495.1 PQQ-binding-like beta-propeller repeat protein [Parvibaculum sp.]